jgi:hypothetical protein
MEEVWSIRRWYVLAAISLMGGALLLALALSALYLPWGSGGDVKRQDWRAGELTPKRGTAVRLGDRIELTLDATGFAAVTFPARGLSASAYPYVNIRTAGDLKGISLILLWRGAKDTARGYAGYSIPQSGRSSLWISMRRVSRWTGELAGLGIGFKGRPGQTVLIKGVRLAPPELSALLQAAYDQWTAFRPWQQPSINTYFGVGAPAPLLYPVPTFAALLGLSLLVYGLLWFFQRRDLPFDWRVPSALAVVCWLALDLPWQGRLWTQVQETYRRFAGLTEEQKHLAASDGALFAFMERVKRAIHNPDARLFLATGGDYTGVRGAYHLFPRNVYWRRGKLGLPDPKYMRPGDYIVLFESKQVRFDSGDDTLVWPKEHRLKVRRIFRERQGSLFKAL